ncbi:hypothetical protein Tco_0143778 [Tanacetum coccineum]
MNYQPLRSENQANKHAGPKEANHNVGTEVNIDAVKSSKAMNTGEEPNKHPDLKTDEKPIDKEDQDLLLQAGAAKASSTNIVNTASTPVSTASPYDGLSFTNLTNTDKDDSEIPALEEIYDNPTAGIFTNASYDDEGAVADFTNLETIVNASPIPTSRINSIHPSTLILGDPKSISEALEDESWVDAMQEELLQFKIQKVLILVDLPYGKKAIGTKWVYRNKKDERGVVVRNKARIEDIRIFLAFAFFMGFIVYQMDVKSASVWQTLMRDLDVMNFETLVKYVAERNLKKFDFVVGKAGCTPIETQKPLVKDEEASDVDVHLYRSMIGSLMYLSASRPDIMFAVYAYSRVSSFDLEAYSDSDHAGANLDRKSTIGGCQFLGRRLISWQCKKHTIVTTSTIEAEYVAAANCCGQVF